MAGFSLLDLVPVVAGGSVSERIAATCPSTDWRTPPIWPAMPKPGVSPATGLPNITA